ncbi:hypothetical protein ThvES_00004970 [Thiovulum sp. ES]|nr:hypothetical protein ThvES_00004970 [Thiovulum sp. ES]
MNTELFVFQNRVVCIQKNSKYKWIVSNSSISVIFEAGEKEVENLKNDTRVRENVDFLFLELLQFPENKKTKTLFWTRRGSIKIAYLLKNEKSLDIIDFLEEIEFKDENNAISEIEDVLNDKLKDIKKGKSLQEIEDYIGTLSKFLRNKEFLQMKKEGGIKGFLLEFFDDAIKQTFKEKGN